MVKPISSAVSAQLAVPQRRPVNLVILDLGSGVTLRYAAAKQNVTFPTAGNTYTAKNIEYTAPGYSAEGQLNSITVKLDNTARDMTAYAINRDFKGKKITVLKIFRDASGTTDYDLVFNGWMETPFFDYSWITIPADTGTALDKRTPHRSYGRKCPWAFGGTECNADGNADLTSNSLTTGGVTVKGGVTYFYDTMLQQSASTTWENARVSLYISGASEERLVTKFTQAAGPSGGTVEFDVPCSVNISSNTKYEMIMACTKSWTACSGVSPFGPIADNTANFGGFLHITDKPAPVRYK